MRKLDTFKNTWVADHPLVNHKLSQIRKKEADKRLFRNNVKQIAQIMAYAVSSDYEEKLVSIDTPLETIDSPFLKNDYPVLVPILRAGLALCDGLEELFPESTVAHVGVYRDHETLEAVEYLNKLPDLSNRDAILVDPMLATGNSAAYVIEMMKKKNMDLTRLAFMVLVAAPEGIKHIENLYPDVKIYTAAVDRELNDQAYIMPGLGDAGDRNFGTI